MATNTRPELSEKNLWWISKHRYYELRHFCLQCLDWKKTLNDLDGLPSSSPGSKEKVNEGQIYDPTPLYANLRKTLTDKINMITSAAYEACDHQFWYTILMDAVITGTSYDILEANNGIMPVSRNEWYILYRKFFWFLDKLRD